MNFETKFKINKNLVPSLEKVSDRQMYAIARKTLDASIPRTPQFSRKMRMATSGFHGVGVEKIGSKEYQIGSATDYASTVYMYPEATHWTTPGTNNRWFIRTWETLGKNITKIVLSKEKLK